MVYGMNSIMIKNLKKRGGAMKIYPSLISADLLNLQSSIQKLEPHCDGFHIDVMDNHFVPNLTWGAQFIKAISSCTQKPLFIHLMIDFPEKFIEKIHMKAGGSVAIHIENTKNILQASKGIRENKWHVSLAINPKTPLEELKPYLPAVDSVLLMSVNPGFSGQDFLESSFGRLDELSRYRKGEDLNFEIVMDGGITTANIGRLAKNGCDAVGVASAIFNQEDPIAALKVLYRAADSN